MFLFNIIFHTHKGIVVNWFRTLNKCLMMKSPVNQGVLEVDITSFKCDVFSSSNIKLKPIDIKQITNYLLY